MLNTNGYHNTLRNSIVNKSKKWIDLNVKLIFIHITWLSNNVLLCYLLLVFSFILVQLNATLHLTNRQNNLLHYTFYVCLLKSKCISYMSYIDIANVHIPSEFLIFRLIYFRQYRIRPRFNSISSRCWTAILSDTCCTNQKYPLEILYNVIILN